jgi:hypothetical protein
VVLADFNSVALAPSRRGVGSTPTRSRQSIPTPLACVVLIKSHWITLRGVSLRVERSTQVIHLLQEA